MTRTAPTPATRGRDARTPGRPRRPDGGDGPAAEVEARAMPARREAGTFGSGAPASPADLRASSRQLAVRQAAADASPHVVAQARMVRAARGGRWGPGVAATAPVLQRMPVEAAAARLSEWLDDWEVTAAEGTAAALAAWVTGLEELLAGDQQAIWRLHGDVEDAFKDLAFHRSGETVDATCLDDEDFRAIAEGVRATARAVAEVPAEPPDETGMRRMPVDAPLPWARATGAEVKTSGNGGIAIVRFGGGVVVAKGAGSAANREVLAARLATELGLRAPPTRLLEAGEAEAIEVALSAHGKRMPARPREGSSAPTLVMEYVEGKDLSDVGHDLPSAAVESLARSMGAWLAFDILVNERDRFPSVRGAEGTSVNSANFRVGGTGAPELAGIDQQVSPAAEPSPALARALEADVSLYRDAAVALRSLTGATADADDLAPFVQTGAEEVFTRMGQRLGADALARLAGGLGIDAEVTDRLTETLAALARRFPA